MALAGARKGMPMPQRTVETGQGAPENEQRRKQRAVANCAFYGEKRAKSDEKRMHSETTHFSES